MNHLLSYTGILFLVIIALAGFLIIAACDIDPGLEPLRSGISGTIKFVGDWPANTDQILVVAALKFPPTTITDLVMGEPLPLNVDSLDYILWAPVHQYGAVGLVWKEKDQPWNVTNIIGMYFPGPDQFSPGSVKVAHRDSVLQNIDMVANFAYAKRAVASKITGTVHYQGQWPEDAQAALVVASPNSILAIKSLLELYFTAPLPVKIDSSTYELTMPAGTYKTIGTLIIQENEPIGLTSVKALYVDPKTGFIGQVKIPTDTSIVTGVDLFVNFDTGLAGSRIAKVAGKDDMVSIQK